MKRYKYYRDTIEPCACEIDESDYGEYVLYADVAELEAQLAKLEDKLETSQAIIEVLQEDIAELEAQLAETKHLSKILHGSDGKLITKLQAQLAKAEVEFFKQHAKDSFASYKELEAQLANSIKESK